MRKKWKKIGIFLGMIAIMNSILRPSIADFTIQAEDIQDNVSPSYQSIGNITIEKQNQSFQQEINNGEFVLWNWIQKKGQSSLVGIRNYWNKKGNLEKSKVKLSLKRKLGYFLSFMKEDTQGNIYLFLENKNKQKGMYITAQADGAIKQKGIFDLKILENKKQYTLDDMKIIKNNQLAILYSIRDNEKVIKKKVLFLNTKTGNISDKKEKIEWKENKNRFLQNSFQWGNDFIYSIQDSKILIFDVERQNKKIIEIPEQFQNFSICMAGKTVFLFDLEKGVYYYDMESSNQLEQMDSSILNISSNNKVVSITVTKEKDLMYILLSENKEKESTVESYQLLKYQLKQTEKIVKTISADYKEYSSAQELVIDADWIFTGTVKNITYENIEIPIEESVYILYTIFEIEVSKVYKGDIKKQTVYVKRPGAISDSILYEMKNASKIEYGNRYLFIAEAYENSYASFLNGSQCTFNLDTETENTIHNGITYSEILKLVDN